MPKHIYDWKAIQEYHDEGHGFVECRSKFGLTHTAWNKAIRRGELRTASRPFPDRRQLYDWTAVQRYYDEGHSYRECRKLFGFCAASWSKAVNRGALTARARAWSLSDLLEKSKARGAIKRRLLEAGILDNCCSICQTSEWRGQPLTCHIDHINGVCDDYRLENLRMLCPNCHSQTHTYGGRNAGRRKRLQESNAVV